MILEISLLPDPDLVTKFIFIGIGAVIFIFWVLPLINRGVDYEQGRR
jgi:hypothetical protein